MPVEIFVRSISDENTTACPLTKRHGISLKTRKEHRSFPCPSGEEKAINYFGHRPKYTFYRIRLCASVNCKIRMCKKWKIKMYSLARGGSLNPWRKIHGYKTTNSTGDTEIERKQAYSPRAEPKTHNFQAKVVRKRAYSPQAEPKTHNHHGKVVRKRADSPRSEPKTHNHHGKVGVFCTLGG